MARLKGGFDLSEKRNTNKPPKYLMEDRVANLQLRKAKFRVRIEDVFERDGKYYVRCRPYYGEGTITLPYGPHFTSYY